MMQAFIEGAFVAGAVFAAGLIVFALVVMVSDLLQRRRIRRALETRDYLTRAEERREAERL